MILVKGYLRHLVKLLKKFYRFVSVMYLDEDLKLIFLCEISDIYILIVDGEFALPFDRFYHKSLI